MQPLARFAPRLFFDSIPISQQLRTFRIPNRASLPATSACLQCRIRYQARLFADSSKPSDPSNTSDSLHIPSSQDLNSQIHSQIKLDSTDDVPTDLPSTADERRSAINQRFSHLMDNMQDNIFLASQRINDLTGYSGIEALKTRIVALEKRVQDAQEGVRSSRLKYKTTVAERAATQREVTTLLARKDAWAPTDLERFTSLYRMDHTNEQAVQEAATKLADAEREAEVAAGKLSSSILSRYHEEQIWSDKIRRMSTWGTWGLMGVNVLLFLVFQFGLEPWRRKRLVRGFEEKVWEALEKEKGKEEPLIVGTSDTVESSSQQTVPTTGERGFGYEMATESKSPELDAVAFPVEGESGAEPAREGFDSIAANAPTPATKLSQPETWKAGVLELFSPRLIQVQKKDVTIIALEGAATGAAIVAIIATILRQA